MTPGEISGLRGRLAAGSGENTDPLEIANAILDDNVSHPDPDSDICVLARQLIRRTEILHRALDSLEAHQASIAALTEALTPSADTKAAYIGEFHMGITLRHRGQEDYRRVPIEWTTIKEIMTAISARAALVEGA